MSLGLIIVQGGNRVGLNIREKSNCDTGPMTVLTGACQEGFWLLNDTLVLSEVGPE